jgi:hypothetical protein
LISAFYFVVAGLAAGSAIQEAVGAEADVNLRLAQGAELFAFTLILSHFALHATEFFGDSGHNGTLILSFRREKYPW